ncbi:MAG: sigma-70 family RNA polymerase sigma factor [Butyrivibrio sp.]|nr:sigma-70 family RNA polymerase sigma factor [Butyrivibrio sp.]
MDNKILTEAYTFYYSSLFSYAFFLTHNHAEAEDLVSEAFVKAILSWDGKGSLKSWLFRVLKNQFIDETRKKKKKAEVPEEYLLNLPDPDQRERKEAEQYFEEQKWLNEQIQRMRPADQELMILTLYSGMKDADIAAQMNISVQNLRVKRHRIKQALIEAAKRGNDDERRTD